jgi:hypothetical protein
VVYDAQIRAHPGGNDPKTYIWTSYNILPPNIFCKACVVAIVVVNYSCVVIDTNVFGVAVNSILYKNYGKFWRRFLKCGQT